VRKEVNWLGTRTIRSDSISPIPSLAPGTELVGEYQGSGFKQPVFLVRRSDGQMIQLSRLLYLVAQEVDGQKDFGQIAQRVSREFGRTVSADNVRYLVENKLLPLGMLAANDGPTPKLIRAKPALALKFRVPVLPQGTIRALAAVFRPLFLAPVVVAMLAGLAALDVWLFFFHGGLVRGARETLYQPELLVLVFGLTLLATLFHELGHASACRYGGAEPGRIGVGIYIVWPIFYNDVTDTYRLGRIGRLRADLGGVYFDIIFTLGIAGAYFFTGSEWLLLMVLLLQLDILGQFMPFLRFDGYYVVSDLTGVPDLFARITPVLKSLIPGRGTDRRVDELKPWVRVVITAWVLTTIPALLYVFGVLIASTPQLYATAWDSFLNYQDKVQSAFGEGRVLAGVADLIRIVLLLIPVAGVTLMFLLLGKRLGTVVWVRSRGRLALRIFLLAVAALGFVGGFAVVALGGQPLLTARDLTATLFWATSAIVGSVPRTYEAKRLLLGTGVGLLTLAVLALSVWSGLRDGAGRFLERLKMPMAILVVAVLGVAIGASLPFVWSPPNSNDNAIQRAERATSQGSTGPKPPDHPSGGAPAPSADEARASASEAPETEASAAASSTAPKPSGHPSGGAPAPSADEARASASEAPETEASAAASNSASSSASASSSSSASAVGGNGRTTVTISAAGRVPGSTEYILASATAKSTYACVNGSGQVPDPSMKQTTISRVRAPAQPFTADENGNISGSVTLGPPSAESNTLVCPQGQTERLQSVAYSNAVANTVASTSATATATATATASSSP
jgi:putative peptide zinc metalloprotease protein